MLELGAWSEWSHISLRSEGELLAEHILLFPYIGNVSWRCGTVGGTLALKVRKVLESSQKKSGGYLKCYTPWDNELSECNISSTRN